MDTQNTPIHIKLWHKDFWVLALSNMLLTMAIYMLIPSLPDNLLDNVGLSSLHTSLIMGAYGIGIFILGPFCSWLVQHYRRSRVCTTSIFVMMLAIASLWYYQEELYKYFGVWLLIVLRLIIGATFGLSQMILSSTLIIDKCESFQRTEANHHASWFGRFALSLGPILSILMEKLHVNSLLFSLFIAFLSVLLIKSVKFPFRAPDDSVKIISCDRFFLFQGKWLFLNLSLVTIIMGMIMSIEHSGIFYAMIMAGFFLALISEKYVFADADLKSETISGLFLIGAALLIMLTRRQVIVDYVSPTFIGFGIGIIGSRFLLFFIKLSRHCQRGTSQSTFFLAWEFGLSLGLFLGYSVFYGKEQNLLLCCLIVTVLALIMYNFFTHSWYLKHKNR